MTIQDLGAIGEFLGSVFVLATLVYIAIQTRQSRVSIAAQSARELTADFATTFMDMKDPEIALLVRKGISDWDKLSANEQLQLHVIFLNILVHYSGVLEQEHLRGMKDIVPAYENNVLGLITTRGGGVWWKTMQIAFAPQVVVRLESRLADSKSLPPAWSEYMPWYKYEEAQRGT